MDKLLEPRPGSLRTKLDELRTFCVSRFCFCLQFAAHTRTPGAKASSVFSAPAIAARYEYHRQVKSSLTWYASGKGQYPTPMYRALSSLVPNASDLAKSQARFVATLLSYL